jgi:hypothetical protein
VKEGEDTHRLQVKKNQKTKEEKKQGLHASFFFLLTTT